jgi:serine/threonine protein kinase
VTIIYSGSGAHAHGSRVARASCETYDQAAARTLGKTSVSSARERERVSASDGTRIGAEVAGYRIESLLGRGGMSVVYLAEHMRLGRKVALKLLSSVLSEDEGFRDRFVRESRRAAELDHPNVVPIYDAGESDGQLYIAMRYIQGCDLKTLIAREQRLSTGRTLYILEQVASALDTAHDHDLIHRDVKPANILIAEPSEMVYLADFGVVKHTASRGLTRTGFFIGTVDYAAPEQIEGLPVDARTDVYALGCVLYECLVGKAPFDREGEVAVMHAHLVEPPPLLTAARPDLPKSLNRVIAQAMAKSKDERYNSCEELIEAARGAALQRTSSAAVVPPHAATGPAEESLAGQSALASVTTLEETATPSDAEAASVTGGVVRDDNLQASGAPPTGPPVEATGAPSRAGAGGPPPASGKRPERPMRWLPLALVALAAAALSGVAVYLLTKDDSKPAAAQTVTTTTTPTTPTVPTTPVAAAKGLEGVVLKPVWKQCAVSTTPQPDAVESAVCLPLSNPTTFFPDRLDLSIYPNAAALKKAFLALKAASPGSAALVAGKGSCNGLNWNGDGIWNHAATGQLGGHRFCYFDAKKNAVIVWTHERLGTPSHIDTIGIARIGGRGDQPGLYNWWNFWHERLGKCALPDCVAHLT